MKSDTQATIDEGEGRACAAKDYGQGCGGQECPHKDAQGYCIPFMQGTEWVQGLHKCHEPRPWGTCMGLKLMNEVLRLDRIIAGMQDVAKANDVQYTNEGLRLD